MKLLLSVLAIAATVSGLYDPEGIYTMPQADEVIEGEYIVVFQQHLAPAIRKAHMNKMGHMINSTSIMHEYDINNGDFSGYAARVDADTAAMLAGRPEVRYVQPNTVATIQQCQTQSGSTWGISRTSLDGPISGTIPPYEYLDNVIGDGVVLHILDTGVYQAHQDFGGRVSHGFDSTGEGPGDGNGHGTHVASTAGGAEYGLARACPIVEVKVLNSGGSGSFAGVIAGINYSAGEASGGTRVVGNMSLGGGRNAGVNDATDASVRAGVTMVVASGNSNADACNFSPASAPLAFTVHSSDNTDGRSSFSNFGNCGSIFAPGSSITAAWIGGPTATRTISGTSMAAPHVAGVSAKYWGEHQNASPAEVEAAVVSLGVDGVVRNPGNNSPNVMVMMDCNSV